MAIPLNLRMFFPQEINALLHYNGFDIEQKYGDNERAPFTDSSRRQIIVCAAADAPGQPGRLPEHTRRAHDSAEQR